MAGHSMGPTEMDAYERVFGDATEGDRAYFAREDYVEEAWSASSTPCSRPGRRYTSRSLALGSPTK
jgi:glucose-6-phosphate 1-dehydrogenase